MESIQNRISEFMITTFPPSESGEEYSLTQSLLGTGVIDSIGVLSLVTWLEQEFDIVVDDEDVLPENLDSIESLVKFVEAKHSEQGAD